MTPRRIVVRGPNWLGDLVMAAPAIRAIGDAWPDASVAVAVPAGFAPLVRFATVFSKRYPESTAITVWASSWSRVLGVPLVNVRMVDLRLRLLLSASYQCMAPATFVNVMPFCVLASSWVR